MMTWQRKKEEQVQLGELADGLERSGDSKGGVPVAWMTWQARKTCKENFQGAAAG